ncbi:MAG: YqaJ viral recombinase family protein, partial [Lachnospiraceae bacterium]|nr:YqaJ viral recombinase family protein [Lachnospiraceae bacterium]
NSYRSILELWKDKMGLIQVKETENQYTYFGTIMEPVIKKEFMKRTGLKVRAKNCILQSDEYPFMLADIDGIVKELDGSYSLFEAKTASAYKQEVWQTGIPQEYMAQVQHYLCVTGFQKAYVCAIVGGNTYYCHEIYRDEAYIKELVEKEQAFWNCVVTEIAPNVDGSKATIEFLNQCYPKSNKTETELPQQAEAFVESYLKIEEDIKALTEEKNRLANCLKELLREYEKGYIGNHVVKWTTIEKHSLDSKKVKEILGSHYETCLTTSSYRKFSVA